VTGLGQGMPAYWRGMSDRLRPLNGRNALSSRVDFGRPPDPPLGELRARFQKADLSETEVNFDWPEHRHIYFEFLIVERGLYRARIDGIEITVPSGHMVMVQPGEIHQDLLDAGVKYGTLAFTLHRGGLDPGAMPLIGESVAERVIPIPEDVLNLHRHILSVAKAGGTLSATLIDGLTLTAFALVIRALPVHLLTQGLVRSGEDERFIARLDDFFQRRHFEPLSVRDMARAFDMGPTTFTARCRELLQESPAALLRHFRLERAQDLLFNTEQPIHQIAESLGFANPHHFSRLFKQHFGRSPSSFRPSGYTG
jgi:AraC-like DNA-binding protein